MVLLRSSEKNRSFTFVIKYDVLSAARLFSDWNMSPLPTVERPFPIQILDIHSGNPNLKTGLVGKMLATASSQSVLQDLWIRSNSTFHSCNLFITKSLSSFEVPSHTATHWADREIAFIRRTWELRSPKSLWFIQTASTQSIRFLPLTYPCNAAKASARFLVIGNEEPLMTTKWSKTRAPKRTTTQDMVGLCQYPNVSTCRMGIAPVFSSAIQFSATSRVQMRQFSPLFHFLDLPHHWADS